MRENNRKLQELLDEDGPADLGDEAGEGEADAGGDKLFGDDYDDAPGAFLTDAPRMDDAAAWDEPNLAPEPEPLPAATSFGSLRSPLHTNESAEEASATNSSHAVSVPSPLRHGSSARLMRQGTSRDALVAQLKEQDNILANLRGSVADEPVSLRQLVHDTRKKRDAMRVQVQKMQTKLFELQSQRSKSSKKLERLIAHEKARALLPERTHDPSEDVGTIEEMKAEIKRLRDENSEMEHAAPQQEETRFHLEKLRNERRDAERQKRDLRAERRCERAELRSCSGLARLLHSEEPL